ncbi:hypothetical protein [Duganella sp. CY15W]|uniref:hypothetical protein n=1 Tax=Duganella sp. CY15W TaxID=2692172 RepID=UPI0019285FCB|nr:hypothetical protein [Duganella sp. CY15W]
MRNESHTTMIGILRGHVIDWRKREGWSREAVVQMIVEAHERIEGPSTTGIVFDPTTRDAFERQKVNADRVFRWLDDESKDTNLLPANFMHSIWAAMPMEVRLPCIADCVRPLGVMVGSSDGFDEVEFDAQEHLRQLVKESAEAQLALINVHAGATLPQLEAAHREIEDVHEATSRTRRALAGAIARLRAGASKVRKLNPLRRRQA